MTRCASLATSSSCVTRMMELPLRGELAEEVEDLAAGLGVEVARRLVGEQQGRLVDERAGDGDALPLAARQLIRLMVHPVAQPDGGERLLGHDSALVAADLRVDQRQLDVLQRRGAREEIERLKHEADLLVAHRGQLVIVHRLDRRAVEDVLPGGGAVEAADDVHERRLAGTGGSHDGHVLAVIDDEIDAAQRKDVLRPELVGARERVHFDEVISVLTHFDAVPF